jgi:hypothetical protein
MALWERAPEDHAGVMLQPCERSVAAAGPFFAGLLRGSVSYASAIAEAGLAKALGRESRLRRRGKLAQRGVPGRR